MYTEVNEKKRDAHSVMNLEDISRFISFVCDSRSNSFRLCVILVRIDISLEGFKVGILESF